MDLQQSEVRADADVREPTAPPSTVSTRRPLLLTVLFVIYLGILVWVVLWKLHVPFIGRDDMREIKLVPFARAGGYGASSLFEAVGNVLIFLPFGVYLGLLAPRLRTWQIVVVGAATSLLFEIVQYITAVGSSDVTDVITNTAGTLIGIAIFRLASRSLRAKTPRVFTGICLVATVLGLAVVTLFVLSLPRLPAPTDGHRHVILILSESIGG